VQEFERLINKSSDDRLVPIVSVLRNFSLYSTNFHAKLFSMVEMLKIAPSKVTKDHQLRVRMHVISILSNLLEMSYRNFAEIDGGVELISCAIYVLSSQELIQTVESQRICPMHFSIVRFMTVFCHKADKDLILENFIGAALNLIRVLPYYQTLEVETEFRRYGIFYETN